MSHISFLQVILNSGIPRALTRDGFRTHATGTYNIYVTLCGALPIRASDRYRPMCVGLICLFYDSHNSSAKMPGALYNFSPTHFCQRLSHVFKKVARKNMLAGDSMLCTRVQYRRSSKLLTDRCTQCK